MSYINLGNQIINFDYKEPLEAGEFNKLLRDILNPGIYAGGLVTVGGTSTISIAPFTALLHVGTDKAITAKTTTVVSQTVSEIAPIVYIQYVWENVIENWLDFKTRAEGTSKALNEVTLGTATFNPDGSVLGFSYESRMVPDLFLPENYVGHTNKIIGINSAEDDLSYKDLWAMTTAGQSLFGIGVATPQASLDIKNNALSSIINSINQWIEGYASNGSTTDKLKIYHKRYATGTGDDKSEIRIEKYVDTNKKHYISFKGGGSAVGQLTVGYNDVELITISSAGALSTPTTIVAGTGITATTGNISASGGNVSASGTTTGGTGVIATTGNITASSGNVSASGTVTGGTGVIATTGNISASAGEFIDRTGGSIAPVGTILALATSAVPAGFLACNGALADKTTYANLFASIGHTWKADPGSNKFCLPDLQGTFLRGTGTHGTLKMADTTTAFAGPAVGASANDKFQGHYHDLYLRDNISPVISTGNALDTLVTTVLQNTANAIRNPKVDESGNGTPRTGKETIPVNYGVNYCIKY